MYLLKEFIKIETSRNKVTEEEKAEFLNLIKNQYFSIILDKIEQLKVAGFSDVHF